RPRLDPGGPVPGAGRLLPGGPRAGLSARPACRAAPRGEVSPRRSMLVASDDAWRLAMRKRRDPSASEDDDGPKLISLQDKHDTDRLLHQAFAAGEMDEEEFKRRRGRVYAAVTPRELWKASGHRAGSRERADKADLWRSVRLQVAIVVFAP